MATVILELILTRIFSASAGYHFAFMIVSMTMFGMTAGALYASTRPQMVPGDLFRMLTKHTSFLAVAILLAYTIHLYVNEAIQQIGVQGWLGLTFLVATAASRDFLSGLAMSCMATVVFTALAVVWVIFFFKLLLRVLNLLGTLRQVLRSQFNV